VALCLTSITPDPGMPVFLGNAELLDLAQGRAIVVSAPDQVLRNQKWSEESTSPSAGPGSRTDPDGMSSEARLGILR